MRVESWPLATLSPEQISTVLGQLLLLLLLTCKPLLCSARPSELGVSRGAILRRRRRLQSHSEVKSMDRSDRRIFGFKSRRGRADLAARITIHHKGKQKRRRQNLQRRQKLSCTKSTEQKFGERDRRRSSRGKGRVGRKEASRCCRNWRFWQTLLSFSCATNIRFCERPVLPVAPPFALANLRGPKYARNNANENERKKPLFCPRFFSRAPKVLSLRDTHFFALLASSRPPNADRKDFKAPPLF